MEGGGCGGVTGSMILSFDWKDWENERQSPLRISGVQGVLLLLLLLLCCI